MEEERDAWTNYTTTPYSQFRQATRRHAPSALIPVVAAAAAGRAYDKQHQRFKGIHPWVYAAMARDCMLYSDEFRSKPVDRLAMGRMHNYFVNSAAWDEQLESTTGILSMLLGMAYEQTWYQRSGKHEMARSYLLYTSPGISDQHQHPDESDWEDLLGLPLHSAMTASFVLFGLICTHAGSFDPEFPFTPMYSPFEPLVTAEGIRRLLDLLTMTVAEAKERANAGLKLPVGLQRYAFNPLVERPFVDIGDGLRYAPQPQFVMRSLSTENLYYRGIAKWGQKFGPSFGARIEAYTGRQLRHTGQHLVLPEFTWNKNRSGEMRSSDWFLITPAATILIECKSARMSLEAKAGTGVAELLIEQYIGKAYRQLAKNADEIIAGNRAFAHIPSDRPLIGLVVTAEPMIGANSAETRKRYGGDSIPVMTASLADVELMSSLSPDVLGDTLLQIVRDQHMVTTLSDAIVQIIGQEEVVPNRLIDDTFNELTPFSKLRDALAVGETH
jgi:hypothetical protein